MQDIVTFCFSNSVCLKISKDMFVICPENLIDITLKVYKVDFLKVALVACSYMIVFFMMIEQVLFLF